MYNALSNTTYKKYKKYSVNISMNLKASGSEKDQNSERYKLKSSSPGRSKPGWSRHLSLQPPLTRRSHAAIDR